MSSKKQTSQQTPKWLDKLAGLLCAPHLREEIIGDLHERYQLRAERLGEQKARSLYRREVLGLLRPSIIKRKKPQYDAPSLLNQVMIRNYFKIGFRILIKNKGYSLIHLTGLSIGLWACMMVATVVIDSLSYDKQWSKGKDLYRIVSVNNQGNDLFERTPSSPAGLAPELKRIYPEVDSYSEFSIHGRYLKVKENDTDPIQTQILNADTTIWTMLDIHVLAGNPKVYEAGIGNILITRTFRDKFFNGQNPIGKTIYDIPKFGAKPKPLLVTGLIEDLPYNSHLRADVIVLHNKKPERFSTNGFVTFSQNYLLLKPGTNIDAFSKKVNEWHSGLNKGRESAQFEFQPMAEIYLHSDFADGQNIRGSANTIYIFAGVAVLLLFIACVNFVNLSTARAFVRVREAGIRRVLSSSRSQVVFQLLIEALTLFIAAIVLATVVYQFSLNSVESFLGHKLIQTFTSKIPIAAAALITFLLIGVFTGLYPALLISGLKPANALKGIFSSSTFGQNGIRKGLVVAQFSISIVVLLASIVVRQQLNYMEQIDLGYNQKNLLNIDHISWEGKSEAFKSELLRIPGVTNVSMTQWAPTQGGGNMTREVGDPLNPKNKVKVWYISGDMDLPQTLGLKLVKGRLFDKTFSTDALNTDSLQNVGWEKFEELSKSQTSIITASAAKVLKIKNLNEQILNANTVPIGIVADFKNESLHESVKPTVILAQRSSQYGGMLIRVRPGTEKQVEASIHKLWGEFFTAKILETKWVEDMLAEELEAEMKLHQIFTFFSSLTMFLSALGIFGLVVQAAEQRAKEVGIRKVLGASVAGIVRLLSQDLVKLVFIAIIISSPVAWYFLNKWLENYPFRIEISWWTFAGAGLSAMVVTIITISFQAIKAAMADPAKTLRSE